MKTSVRSLAGWKSFCAACRKDGDGFCPAANRSQLNRFYARYRLAANFEAVHARGYSDRALRGYAAGLRLLAAYSAAELLGDAIQCKVTSWGIHDSDFANSLRKVLGRANDESNRLFSQELRKRLLSFMAGESDVRVAATALRVMVAHGSFTPTGTDSLTRCGADAINSLSDALLDECERRFGSWLQSRIAQHDEVATDLKFV